MKKERTYSIDVNELRIIIKNRFNYERRKFIFFSLNCILIGITVFCLFFSINIESESSIYLLRNSFQNSNNSSEHRSAVL